jgi:hypothetical protein
MSAGELESGNAGEPAKLIRQVRAAGATGWRWPKGVAGSGPACAAACCCARSGAVPTPLLTPTPPPNPKPAALPRGVRHHQEEGPDVLPLHQRPRRRRGPHGRRDAVHGQQPDGERDAHEHRGQPHQRAAARRVQGGDHPPRAHHLHGCGALAGSGPSRRRPPAADTHASPAPLHAPACTHPPRLTLALDLPRPPAPPPHPTPGNDFSTLYAPLIRDGRMEKYYWNPTREDRVGVCMGIFHVSSGAAGWGGGCRRGGLGEGLGAVLFGGRRGWGPRAAAAEGLQGWRASST